MILTPGNGVNLLSTCFFRGRLLRRLGACICLFIAKLDEAVWDCTKTGVFSVKSAYFLRLFLDSDQGIGEGQIRFDKRGKVWGLGLPPKFQLFIWKVLHRIIAVKDALLQWNIYVEPGFPLC